MKIDAANILEHSNQTATVSRTEEQKNTTHTENVFQVEQSRKGQKLMDNPTYGKPRREETTLEDIQEQASGMDAVQQKNEMLFASQTTSEKDAAALEEKGYSLMDDKIETVVTETDKIKMVLAKAGKDISYFGDDLTPEQLSEMAGSEALANQLAQILNQADLPASRENLSDMMDAISVLGEVSQPSDGSILYMLKNQLKATPENLFKAQFSGSMAQTVADTERQIDYAALQPAIEHALEEAGLEVSSGNVESCQWLIANELPLTAENLAQKQALEQIELPMDPQELVRVMTEGIASGVRPQNVDLTQNLKLAKQRDISQDTSFAKDDLDRNADLVYRQIKTMRQLEETRLVMTTEANLALLKKGISIDTMELSELVDALKQQEAEMQTRLGSSLNINTEQQAAIRDVLQEVERIKTLPAYAIGRIPAEELTLNGLKEQGSRLQAQMEQANERYETMQTTPRQDLGDHIQKAFRNVDDILKELELDISESNRRAVRILAYNHTEITQESIRQMKAADEMVQRSFSNMKPAVVDIMIKREINPLDMDLKQLNALAEEIQREQGITEEEKFSKYLYKLEQNQQISQEQRSAYIGIYRLIRQVEATDGAAIASLLQQGGELTLRNLLTQVRSSKHKAMDYQVDDQFGGVSAKESTTVSITDQIEAGYQQDLLKDIRENISPEKLRQLGDEEQWMEMTPEEMARGLEQAEEPRETEYQYQSRQLEDLAQAAAAPEEVYEMLAHYDLPVTVSNVMAVMQQNSHRNRVFQQIFGGEQEDNLSQELQEIKEKLLRDFGEAVKTPREMAEAQEKLAETAENVMKDMIIEKKPVTSIDIREMKVAMSQISLMGEQSREEQYAIPVLVQGELCNVSLKIVRGEEKKGLVDILFDTDRMGKVAATLQATDQGVSAYIATQWEETGELFAGQEENLKEQLGLPEGQELKLHFAVSDTLDLKEFGKEHHNHFRYGETQEDPVQTRTLYRMAESFLNVVKSIENGTDILNS
ncbi:MAG: DUF6240 domain-containing protein [Roseburia sp.]